MTRPIKFRAWDKEARKFFKPEPRLNAMTISITLNGEIIGHPNIGEMTSLYELSQFTGLTDKNDKEIYEGDVVKCTKGCPHIIEFMQEVPSSNIGGMPGFYLSSLNDGYAWTGEEEVIGNIYQHPELLKGGNPA